MSKDEFEAAVNDSHLLVAFLSLRSMTMDEDRRRQFISLADDVSQVQALVADGRSVSETERYAFGQSFALLSRLALPMTIAAIRSHLLQHYRSGMVGRAFRRQAARFQETAVAEVSRRPPPTQAGWRLRLV